MNDEVEIEKQENIKKFMMERLRLINELKSLSSLFTKLEQAYLKAIDHNINEKTKQYLAEQINKITNQMFRLMHIELGVLYKKYGLDKNVQQEFNKKSDYQDQNKIIKDASDQTFKYSNTVDEKNKVTLNDKEKKLFEAVKKINLLQPGITDSNKTVKVKIVTTVKEQVENIRQIINDFIKINHSFINPGGIKQILQVLKSKNIADTDKIDQIKKIASDRSIMEKADHRKPLLQDFYIRLSRIDNNNIGIDKKSMMAAKNKLISINHIAELFKLDSKSDTFNEIRKMLDSPVITVDEKIERIIAHLKTRMIDYECEPNKYSKNRRALYNNLIDYFTNVQNKDGFQDLKNPNYGVINKAINAMRANEMVDRVQSMGIYIK